MQTASRRWDAVCVFPRTQVKVNLRRPPPRTCTGLVRPTCPVSGTGSTGRSNEKTQVNPRTFLLRFRAVVDLKGFKIKAHELTVAVERAARWAVSTAISVASWPVLHYSRWGLYPQAVFVAVTLFWFEYRPEWATQGPGVAMGFLAVAAIFMAVRGPDSTRVEGVLWIAVSCVLFIIEMNSITVERKIHDNEQAELRRTGENRRREQSQSFSKLIADGRNLFNTLAEEKTLTERNLEHITGGDAYCWLVPTHPIPGLGQVPAPQGKNWWRLALKNSGKVVLPTCDIRLVPFSTDKEFAENRQGIPLPPPPAPRSYHFDKVSVMGRRAYRPEEIFITGDRIYNLRIETPTRTFIEIISFAPDPNDPTLYIPKCEVRETWGQRKFREKDCDPQ